MNVRTYVLAVSVGLLSISANTKKAILTQGVNPGDLAPRIESVELEKTFQFKNTSGRYTLLNFWAAYDADSRVRNIMLTNEISKFDSDKIRMCSISLDEKKSIFEETVKVDKLDTSTQFYEDSWKEAGLYAKYNLKKGFRNFLIDDKGMIVSVNISPDELAKMIKTI